MASLYHVWTRYKVGLGAETNFVGSRCEIKLDSEIEKQSNMESLLPFLQVPSIRKLNVFVVQAKSH